MGCLNKKLIFKLLSRIFTPVLFMYIGMLLAGAAEEHYSFLDAFKKLGYVNLLFFTVLALSGLSAYVTSIKPLSCYEMEKKELIESILKNACDSLKLNKNLHVRAIVSIPDYKQKTRTITYACYIRSDPEWANRKLDLYLGIVGEVFRDRKIVARNISAEDQDQYPEGAKIAILPNLKSILAVPVTDSTDPGGELLGVLNFDSTEDISKAGLDTPQSAEIVNEWALLIGKILQSPALHE